MIKHLIMHEGLEIFMVVKTLIMVFWADNMYCLTTSKTTRCHNPEDHNLDYKTNGNPLQTVLKM